MLGVDLLMYQGCSVQKHSHSDKLCVKQHVLSYVKKSHYSLHCGNYMCITIMNGIANS